MLVKLWRWVKGRWARGQRSTVTRSLFNVLGCPLAHHPLMKGRWQKSLTIMRKEKKKKKQHPATISGSLPFSNVFAIFLLFYGFFLLGIAFFLLGIGFSAILCIPSARLGVTEFLSSSRTRRFQCSRVLPQCKES